MSKKVLFITLSIVIIGVISFNIVMSKPYLTLNVNKVRASQIERIIKPKNPNFMVATGLILPVSHLTD